MLKTLDIVYLIEMIEMLRRGGGGGFGGWNIGVATRAHKKVKLGLKCLKKRQLRTRDRTVISA